MQRFDVLSDGPFRYIHSTDTGELFAVLFRWPDGRFSDEHDDTIRHTLREWKAILARKWDRSRGV